jgi:4'-phosphopantetheinyl transferase
VLGKRLARTLLGRSLHRPPESIEFAAGPAGKPELAGSVARSGLAFNLAHSGTEVVCAVAVGRPVGVDIERERDDLGLLDLAHRFFCPNEIQRLEAGPPERTVRLFFTYWTLKEAYLKAEGSGLGLDLTAMDASGVPDLPRATPCAPVEDRPRGLLVQPVEAPFGYLAAVASAGPPWTVRRHSWRAQDFAREPRRLDE